MHTGDRIFLRAIPLAITLYEVLFGFYTILHHPSDCVPGRFLVSLGSITFAIYSAVAVALRQGERHIISWPLCTWPICAFIGSLAAILWGIILLLHPSFINVVSGHMVFGAGLIAICVSTVSLISLHLTDISWNEIHLPIGQCNYHSWSRNVVYILASIPILATISGVIDSLISLVSSSEAEQIGGHALSAQTLVCLSFVLIVWVLGHQMNNTFTGKYKWRYGIYITVNGLINIIWGLFTALTFPSAFRTCGWGMVALGLVCISVSGKMHRINGYWHDKSELAIAAHYFPLVAAFTGFLLSDILFSCVVHVISYVWAAYAVGGLSAVCACAFALVAVPSPLAE